MWWRLTQYRGHRQGWIHNTDSAWLSQTPDQGEEAHNSAMRDNNKTVKERVFVTLQTSEFLEKYSCRIISSETFQLFFSSPKKFTFANFVSEENVILKNESIHI